jgi:membrane protein DedA with SNARE-associated domain
VAHVLEHYGLLLLFVLIALESFGLPLPGETALIAAAVLSAEGRLPAIGWVILSATLAAIAGDNGGYWAGRTGGRRLLARWRRLERLSERLLPEAERFFARHGGKAVFLARFVTGLRITGAWMAGLSRMRWRTFLLWNALGGVTWAAGVGLVSYYLGQAAGDAFRSWGAVFGGALLALLVAGLLLFGYYKHRLERRELERPPPD